MTNKLKAITQRSQMEMEMSQEESGRVRVSHGVMWKVMETHENCWKVLEDYVMEMLSTER